MNTAEAIKAAKAQLFECIGRYGVDVSTTGELAPSRELIDAVEALSALSSAEQQPDYAALEREHLGDPDKRTGIYAPQASQPDDKLAESEIWPIVNIDVDGSGNVTNAKLYAPGLPAGNHDVYPVRVPYMDEHTEAWLACSAAIREFISDYFNRNGMNGIECAVAAIRELGEGWKKAQAFNGRYWFDEAKIKAAIHALAQQEQQAPAVQEEPTKLAVAIDFIRNTPHGENCFVSDHYEGDPGNRCYCGKDNLLDWLENDDPAPAQTEEITQGMIDAALAVDIEGEDDTVAAYKAIYLAMRQAAQTGEKK